MVKCRTCGEEAEIIGIQPEIAEKIGTIVIIRARKFYVCHKCKIEFETIDYRAVDFR